MDKILLKMRKKGVIISRKELRKVSVWKRIFVPKQ